MVKKKVVRVTKEEFELDDGTIYQHFEKLDVVPTLEEFQEMYDNWYNKLTKDNNG